MGTTNYFETFIRVAEDCPADVGEVPPPGFRTKSVAALQYELISGGAYTRTSDDLLFDVYAIRNTIPAGERAAAREAFFAGSQACLRASPLAKRYGWGIHFDEEGRVGIVALGSERYLELSSDDSLRQLKAMRSKRS